MERRTRGQPREQWYGEHAQRSAVIGSTAAYDCAALHSAGGLTGCSSEAVEQADPLSLSAARTIAGFRGRLSHSDFVSCCGQNRMEMLVACRSALRPRRR